MALRSAIVSPSASDPYGTVGVDMAANPLTLGTRKLHSAVNLRFEEGVIKTRPGYRYHKLGVCGQFQGGLHYNPSKGLSSRPFAPQASALVVVVSGKVFMAEASDGRVKCGTQPMCGTYDFACKGAVHLFQAENWLVVQNPLSNTFFWEGFGCLSESPGMAGDPTDSDPALPHAPKPRLGKCWTTNTFVRFTVVKDSNGDPLPGALVKVRYGERLDYSGNTNAKGRITFHPVPKSYTYEVTLAGYLPVLARPLIVPPNSTQFIEVRMIAEPGGSGGTCGLTVTNTFYDVTGVSFRVTNTGSRPSSLLLVEILGGSNEPDAETSLYMGGHIQTLPLVIPPGSFVFITRFDRFEGPASYVLTSLCNGIQSETSGNIP